MRWACGAPTTAASRIDAVGKMFDGAKLERAGQPAAGDSEPFRCVPGNVHREPSGVRLGTRDGASRYAGGARRSRRKRRQNNNRFSSFILGIVKSTPFQMRRAEETDAGDDGRRCVANR